MPWIQADPSGNSLIIFRFGGRKYSVDSMGLCHLLSYVNDRAKEPGLRARLIAASTIKNEIMTVHG